MRRIWIALAVLACCVAAAPGRAAEADEQRALVQRFIAAYFTKDMPTVRACLPKKHAALFTRYPFSGAITLAQPKVDENQALVEFSGPVADGQFIGKGGILLSRHGKLWQVRQILFYNKIPRIFNLPSRSKTKEDRAQEGTVAHVARRFVAEWKEHDSQGMLALWYNWVKDNPERIAHLSMTDFQLTNGRTKWNDPCVHYTVKLAYRLFGKIPLSMNASGSMVLVKDDGAWKVRGNSFILRF